MNKLNNIIILYDSRPPQKTAENGSDSAESYVEDDVASALKELELNCEKVPVNHSLKGLIETIETKKPDLVFNLTESYLGNSAMEAHIVALLDMLNILYTGSGAASLIISCDKGIQKKLLAYHGIMTPDFTIFPIGKTAPIPETLRFPLIVKPLQEDASIGIHECSIVKNNDALVERIKFVHSNNNQPALVEEFIEGREFYIGIIGNEKLQVLPIVELDLSGLPEGKPKIASYRVKWNETYRKKMGIKSVFPSNLDPEIVKKINEVCLNAYKILGIQSYGRIDIRLSENNDIYMLEANPNPYIAKGEDLPNAAAKAGIEYNAFIGKIIEYALSKRK